MVLKSTHTGATWIFPAQEQKLRDVLYNMTMINSVKLIEHDTYQTLEINIHDSYLETPSEIFNLGMLVQALLQ